MEKDFYNELYNNLLVRYKNARAHNCPRTASARLRDMARLQSDYTGEAYMVCLQNLKERYNMTLTN